ncbi:hypothetical protein RUM44_004967 [Polyplax serrata]|uniref:Uncharacterized protein n=1 Tax=Polyplax serrata TaxID=468196 RepID=A0ABR1AWL7_POLSC
MSYMDQGNNYSVGYYPNPNQGPPEPYGNPGYYNGPQPFQTHQFPPPMQNSPPGQFYGPGPGYGQPSYGQPSYGPPVMNQPQLGVGLLSRKRLVTNKFSVRSKDGKKTIRDGRRDGEVPERTRQRGTKVPEIFNGKEEGRVGRMWLFYKTGEKVARKVEIQEGDWMPMPQGPPNCPPGLEYLISLSNLFVKQKVEFLEAITGRVSEFFVVEMIEQ